MFQFKVKWYNDGEMHVTCGIVYGPSWTDAMSRLSDMYGVQGMSFCKMIPLGDDIIEYNESVADITNLLEG